MRAAIALTVVAPAAAAFGQSPFTEEALIRGVSYFVSVNTGPGQGVGMVDLDGDHDPDLVLLGRSDNIVGIFENVGTGYFIDRSLQSGMPALSATSGVAAGDYDGDGDLDLYITRLSTNNRLFRNLGGFQFDDVTALSGTGDIGPGEGPCWGDYNGDGWLDLYVPNYTNGFPNSATALNRLYRNDANGTFTEVGAALGVNDPGYGFQGVFFDYDRDGDVDLYLANDRGSLGAMYGNRLWRNDGGQFVDVSATSGTDGHSFLMGVACGDFDGNGYPDIYTTNIASYPNPLYLNQGTGNFIDASAALAVTSFRSGWGTLFFDYDNDGPQELHVCNQFGGASSKERLYLNPLDGPCTDSAVPLALAGQESDYTYGSAVGDVDGDGDLDLLTSSWNRPIALFINHEGELRNWLKVRLVGAGANTHAIGATVDVAAAGVTRMRQVMAGISYKSECPTILHFGLNTAASADSVTVYWPGDEITVRTAVASNQTLVICHPSAAADLNADRLVSPADIGLFVSALLQGAAILDCRGDLNADGSVDGLDIPLFIDRLLP